MLNKILVPLDGSDLSERAVPFAAAIARGAGAKVLLMRAVLTARIAGPEFERFNAMTTGQAEADLESVATSMKATHQDAEWFVWDDERGFGIVDAARAKAADLIVMSTHGRNGLGRFIFGSVADGVLRSSPVPVLLVPPSAQPDWAAADPLRIVVPLDGSPFAEEALAPTYELARALRAEVTLVRAIEPPNPWVMDGAYTDSGSMPALAVEAQRYLDHLAASAVRQVPRVSVRRGQGVAAHVIADVAHEQGAHLVAMASHTRGGLARALLGSVAQDVLRATRVPVLIVRPTAVRVPESEPAEYRLRANSPGEAPLVAVLMSREDVDLARLALEALADGASVERVRQSARALLERLRQVPDARGEPVSAGRAS
jgi:nucleotide-binding universal stress UspA family protein